MRKLSILFTLIVMLVGVSAQAQRKNPPPEIRPVVKILSVQDQEGDGYIWFNIATGEFTCNMCEYGYVINGTGQVKIDGFNVYLGAVTDEYQMFVSINVWDRQGKAVVELFKAPDMKFESDRLQENWTDLNIDDNKLVCNSIYP